MNIFLISPVHGLWSFLHRMGCKRPIGTLWFFSVIFFYPAVCHAYLDPGTGNVLIYVLVSLLGSLLYFAKELLYGGKRLFRKGGQQSTGASRSGPDAVFEPDILVFSEGKMYWLTFKPIIDGLLAKNIPFTYLSMDVEDPGLTIEHPIMHSRYIGEGSAAFARATRYRAYVMLSTTPNIGTPGFPMPRPKNIDCLAHVCHGVGDIALYHKGSLDHYDAVLMVGDFMLPSIRAVEHLRRLVPKECLSLGLPYLDVLAEHVHLKKEISEPPVVLVAPSWGEKSSITLYGADLLLKLAEAGFAVIFRPHPYSLKVEKELMDEVFLALKKYPLVTIDTQVDGSVSMGKADIMVSDKSCIRFDFAFLYEKPVVSLDIPLPYGDVYEVSDLRVVWEDTVAHRLGPVLAPEQFDGIVEVVREALHQPPESLRSFRNECVACQGYSGEAIVEWAEQKVQTLKGEA